MRLVRRTDPYMAETESTTMASEEGVPPQRLLVLGGTGSTGKWFVGHALNHGYIACTAPDNECLGSCVPACLPACLVCAMTVP